MVYVLKEGEEWLVGMKQRPRYVTNPWREVRRYSCVTICSRRILGPPEDLLKWNSGVLVWLNPTTIQELDYREKHTADCHHEL